MNADSRPKILYLITDVVSSGFLRGQLAFLIESGYEVHVGVHVGGPATGQFDPGVEVHELSFERVPSPWRDLKALFAVLSLIRRLRPDIVNSSTPKAGLLGSVASWLCRTPVRVYVVRGFKWEVSTGNTRRFLLGLESLAMACANHVVFNSASLQMVAEENRVIRRGRGVVLGRGSGNGVDTARFCEIPSGSLERLRAREEARNRFGFRADQIVLAFIGRMTVDKGIQDFVELFCRHLKDLQDVGASIVGAVDSGDRPRRRILAELERDERCVLAGWVDDMSAVYPAIDVLVFPSHREGLPNAVLEAQACGVPIVGYAATGTVDAIDDGKTGLLVPTGDISALSSAVASLIANEKKRRSMSQEGPRWISQNFSRERVWSELREAYCHWIVEDGCQLSFPNQ